LQSNAVAAHRTSDVWRAFQQQASSRGLPNGAKLKRVMEKNRAFGTSLSSLA
jgi:hypothetical protein